MSLPVCMRGTQLPGIKEYSSFSPSLPFMFYLPDRCSSNHLLNKKKHLFYTVLMHT